MKTKKRQFVCFLVVFFSAYATFLGLQAFFHFHLYLKNKPNEELVNISTVRLVFSSVTFIISFFLNGYLLYMSY